MEDLVVRTTLMQLPEETWGEQRGTNTSWVISVSKRTVPCRGVVTRREVTQGG